jgi:hypothetical protein
MALALIGTRRASLLPSHLRNPSARGDDHVLAAAARATLTQRIAAIPSKTGSWPASFGETMFPPGQRRPAGWLNVSYGPELGQRSVPMTLAGGRMWRNAASHSLRGVRIVADHNAFGRWAQDAAEPQNGCSLRLPGALRAVATPKCRNARDGALRRAGGGVSRVPRRSGAGACGSGSGAPSWRCGRFGYRGGAANSSALVHPPDMPKIIRA